MCGQVARTREGRGACRVLVVKREDGLEVDLGVDGRIIWKLIFKEWAWSHALDRSGLEWGQVTGSCECSMEPSGSLKHRFF
jgi:hypothetical protein